MTPPPTRSLLGCKQSWKPAFHFEVTRNQTKTRPAPKTWLLQHQRQCDGKKGEGAAPARYISAYIKLLITSINPEPTSRPRFSAFCWLTFGNTKNVIFLSTFSHNIKAIQSWREGMSSSNTSSQYMVCIINLPDKEFRISLFLQSSPLVLHHYAFELTCGRKKI